MGNTSQFDRSGIAFTTNTIPILVNQLLVILILFPRKRRKMSINNTTKRAANNKVWIQRGKSALYYHVNFPQHPSGIYFENLTGHRKLISFFMLYIKNYFKVILNRYLFVMIAVTFLIYFLHMSSRKRFTTNKPDNTNRYFFSSQ